MATDQLMTYAEAGAYTGLSPHTIRRWASERRLTKIKYGNPMRGPARVRKSELDALIKAGTVKARRTA